MKAKIVREENGNITIDIEYKLYFYRQYSENKKDWDYREEKRHRNKEFSCFNTECKNYIYREILKENFCIKFNKVYSFVELIEFVKWVNKFEDFKIEIEDC